MVVDSWYNGYSPQERDAKYKELQKQVKSGQLSSPKGPCDLCRDPEVAVEYHDEDYGLPYLWTKPALLCLCRHCHRYKLHKRFNNPSNWHTFLAHIRRGGYARDLKDKLIIKELKNYDKALKDGMGFRLSVLRPYTATVGEEWFAKVRMDKESLTDPKARPRG